MLTDMRGEAQLLKRSIEFGRSKNESKRAELDRTEQHNEAVELENAGIYRTLRVMRKAREEDIEEGRKLKQKLSEQEGATGRRKSGTPGKR